MNLPPDLVSATEAFHATLEAARQRGGALDWYRYESLTGIGHIEELLAGSRYSLPKLLAEGAVADIGCADGELAFFLESLGVQATAIDHPKSNLNGMRGVRALRQALGSRVEIREIDIDDNFDLGDSRFGLACLLGVLYHVKNPFYVLEKLSRHARYCLLSTRIAKYLPGCETWIAESPVAYLLDDYELNGDPTNFWIFSETGLRRLVSRAQWSMRVFQSFGETKVSDPVTLDERCFCLLESRYGSMETVDLVEGWYPPEESGWRWTRRRFEAKAYGAVKGRVAVRLDLYVPDVVVERFGSVTLSASVNGQPLEPATFAQVGPAVYERTVEVAQSPAVLTFELDRAMPPAGADVRELGIIVNSLSVSAA